MAVIRRRGLVGQSWSLSPWLLMAVWRRRPGLFDKQVDVDGRVITPSSARQLVRIELGKSGVIEFPCYPGVYSVAMIGSSAKLAGSHPGGLSI